MKRLLNFVLIGCIIILSGCASSQYYLKQGNYPMAIEAATQKLRKNPKKADKHIMALEQAFKIERNNILNQIEQLRLEGQPSSWVKIYNLYEQLDRYQKAMAPVLPLFIRSEFRNADIELTNINQELADTKKKAAEFLYADGERLLTQNNKNAARQAFTNFRQVKDLFVTYKDIDTKLEESFAKGQNHVLIEYFNTTQMIIPEMFFTNLMAYDERQLNGEWTTFAKQKDSNRKYDYYVDVLISSIAISPEQVRESTYTDTKTVQDGVKYVLDNKGNVKKDAAGNDVTEPNMINVSANVTQVQQSKAGTLTGAVIYKNGNGQVIKTFPFREDLVFNNFFATFQGNKNALSSESLKKIGGRFVTFPPDMQMVMDASEIVKNKSFNLIRANNNLVMN